MKWLDDAAIVIGALLITGAGAWVYPPLGLAMFGLELVLWGIFTPEPPRR